MVGGGGGMIVNQKYFIGGYGEGLSTLHKRPDVYHTGFDPNNEPLTGPEYQNLAVSFGHGGIWLGYINNSNKLIHWGVQSKIGGGGIALYDRKYNFDEYNEVANDAVFVLEPEILLEVNITKWFKTSFSLGYRYVGSVNNSTYFNNEGKEIPYYDKTEFNSPLAGINFMFGGFSKR